MPEGVDDHSQVDLDRRRALKVVGGSLSVAVGGKAADNVLLGYGPVVGTNLRAQADSGTLEELVLEDLIAAPATVGAGNRHLALSDDRLLVRDGQDRTLAELSRTAASIGDAREVDERHDLDGATEQLLRDVGTVDRAEVSVEPSTVGTFFETLRAGEYRPYTIGLVRGSATADPAMVQEFTDTDPADPMALIDGLATSFREQTYYDIPRYLAGSIQDNVIFGAMDLRKYFRHSVDFEALAASGQTGVFCYEFVNRSIEALHAVSPLEQTPPVVAGLVHDGRHKHAYTIVASVIRREEELVVPATFVDYTHATLYDDLALRGVLGNGLEAFNNRHRAEAILWPE